MVIKTIKHYPHLISMATTFSERESTCLDYCPTTLGNKHVSNALTFGINMCSPNAYVTCDKLLGDPISMHLWGMDRYSLASKNHIRRSTYILTTFSIFSPKVRLNVNNQTLPKKMIYFSYNMTD